MGVKDFLTRLISNWREQGVEYQPTVKSDRYMAELLLLQDINKAISVNFNLEELLDKIIKFSIRVISQAQKGAIIIVDEIDRKKLVVRGTYGFSKDTKGEEHFWGEGYTGWVAREEKPLLAHNVPEDYRKGRFVSRFTPLKLEMGIKSSVAVPIMHEKKVMGVIILHSTETTHAFAEDDLRLLSVIADQVAIAIENNRLYQETEASLIEHQALYQIGLLLTSAEDIGRIFDLIVESAKRITGTPAGSLALYDEEKREFYLASSIGFSPSFEKLPAWKLRHGGLTDRILNEDKALIVSDITNELAYINKIILDEGIRSLVAVPLKLENKVVGILYVDDFVPREYKEREIAALTLLANQATIALLRAQTFRHVMELAITDGLTQVFNHRYFQERLAQEVKRAKRYRHPLSLIMIDIDHFKNYNDFYGHQKGDVILKAVADLVKEMIRETDIVARYGGEEFAVILPETGKNEALAVARKIRVSIEREAFYGEEILPQGQFTVSCGVATFPDDTQTRHDLIDHADRALYLAKQTGRNKVCVA